MHLKTNATCQEDKMHQLIDNIFPNFQILSAFISEWQDFRKKPSKAIKGTFGVLSGITQPSCLYHSQFYWISLFTVLMIKFEKLPKQIQSYKATLKILPLYILTAQGFLFNFEFFCN